MAVTQTQYNIAYLPTARPANPVLGCQYVDLATGKLYIHDGMNWVHCSDIHNKSIRRIAENQFSILTTMVDDYVSERMKEMAFNSIKRSRHFGTTLYIIEDVGELANFLTYFNDFIEEEYV